MHQLKNAFRIARSLSVVLRATFCARFKDTNVVAETESLV